MHPSLVGSESSCPQTSSTLFDRRRGALEPEQLQLWVNGVGASLPPHKPERDASHPLVYAQLTPADVQYSKSEKMCVIKTNITAKCFESHSSLQDLDLTLTPCSKNTPNYEGS